MRNSKIRKVPLTGRQPPGLNDRFSGIHRKGVRNMTAADIFLIFIGITGLLISFGSLVVAFLTFPDKSNSKKK